LGGVSVACLPTPLPELIEEGLALFMGEFHDLGRGKILLPNDFCNGIELSNVIADHLRTAGLFEKEHHGMDFISMDIRES